MAISNIRPWIKRVETARHELHGLNEKSQALREILGDNYRSIFEHENLKISESVPTFQALSTSTNGNI
jgi:hypothetical protein